MNPQEGRTEKTTPPSTVAVALTASKGVPAQT